VTVGHIYVIDTALARPPKEKITVCICTADYLFFWINTKPARHGDGQLPLSKGEHFYLTHDCYLDCSRVTSFPPDELDAAKPIGPISKEMARRIINLLTNDPPKTLPKRYADRAIANLACI
jgi:hypothetical protein